MSYCARCGKQCVRVPTGYFDCDTGKPAYRAECPSRIIGHYGLDNLPEVHEEKIQQDK